MLFDSNTRVLVQGITGKMGSFHTEQCLAYAQGRKHIVAGVSPRRGGQRALGLPVFATVAEACEKEGCNVAVQYVPAPFAADAIREASDAGIEWIVCITEGIPVLDMIACKKTLTKNGTRLIGPNCPGVIVPGMLKLGIMPAAIHKPGKVGVVSRSGTLTYEIVWQLSNLGIGQSCCIGIGGDAIHGMTFVDALRDFNQDSQTDLVVMSGEIGGSEELLAADYIRTEMTKPVVAYIAGQSAPADKRMGHAGAIISSGNERAQDKLDALEAASAHVTSDPTAVGKLVKKIL